MPTIFNSFTINNNTARNIDVRLVVNGKRVMDIPGIPPGPHGPINPNVANAQTATVFILEREGDHVQERVWQQVFVGGGLIPAYVLSLDVQYNGGASFEGKAVAEFV